MAGYAATTLFNSNAGITRSRYLQHRIADSVHHGSNKTPSTKPAKADPGMPGPGMHVWGGEVDSATILDNIGVFIILIHIGRKPAGSR